MRVFRAANIMQTVFMSFLVIIGSLYSYIFLSIPVTDSTAEYEQNRDALQEMRVMWIGTEAGILGKVYVAVFIFMVITLIRILYGDEIANLLRTMGANPELIAFIKEEAKAAQDVVLN
jgi:hypothetical protein